MGLPPVCVCGFLPPPTTSVCVCVCVQLIYVRRETAGWNQSSFSGKQNKQTSKNLTAVLQIYEQWAKYRLYNLNYAKL